MTEIVKNTNPALDFIGVDSKNESNEAGNININDIIDNEISSDSGNDLEIGKIVSVSNLKIEIFSENTNLSI